MDASNVSWECINCGMPNFSTALFNSTYSIESDNHFSHLSKNSILISPCVPAAASSPKLPESSRHDRKDISNKVRRPIKVRSINVQLVCNKKSDLEEIINSTKPDIITDTETWLNSSVPSNELFRPNMYNVYRKNRPQDGNGANSNHGGVLIAISKEFIRSEIKELQTDCEIVWVEINIAGTNRIIIGSYYRPSSDDGTSLNNLDESFNRLKRYHTSNIWPGGDFNLCHIDWSVPSFVSGKPEPKLHSQLLDIIDEHSLHQAVDKLTRKIEHLTYSL